MSDRATPETESHFPSSRHKDDSWVVSCEIGLIRGFERQRDEARELAVDLQSALITTLASLIIRMGPEDADTVENAHRVLGKAKQLLKP